MLVDVQPISRLHGRTPLDVAGALGPVIDGLVASGLDLTRARVVCDWVQYKHNFRSPVDVRAVCPGAAADREGVEVAVDLRRATTVDLRAETEAAVVRYQAGLVGAGIALEDWGPGSRSCIWDFNGLYWRALDQWEQSTGRAYEQALPGGESDARNVAGVREVIEPLFEVWDRLVVQRALPDELYVVEIGVGNGNQAQVWLDEFRRLDVERGSDYYRRLHYLMCDYSPYVLELARAAVAEHAAHVSALVLDAVDPLAALSFLRYRVFLVYCSNVYDNLPTDEVANLAGRTYLTEVRAYLPAAEVGVLTEEYAISEPELSGVIGKLLRLGPELLSESMPATFPTSARAVEFWRAVWAALELAERYRPIDGLDRYALAPEVDGEMLRPLLESGDDVRMHVNNGAVASFTGTLVLLHPYGRLISHDLFATGVEAYRTGFRGPGKYEGSVVCWINGPLLAHIGRRLGFDVSYQPFSHRPGTNIVTLVAQARD